MQVALRYASCVALCELAHVWAKLFVLEEEFSTAKIGSLNLEWFIVDCGINACCGTFRYVVENLSISQLVGLAYKDTSKD